MLLRIASGPACAGRASRGRAARERDAASSAFAPARPGTAAHCSAPTRRDWKWIRQWILAVLNAQARRRIELALGERVAEFNQAIRIGAQVRRQIETQTEDQK